MGKKSAREVQIQSSLHSERVWCPFSHPVIEDNTPEKEEEHKLYSKPHT